MKSRELSVLLIVLLGTVWTIATLDCSDVANSLGTDKFHRDSCQCESDYYWD